MFLHVNMFVDTEMRSEVPDKAQITELSDRTLIAVVFLFNFLSDQRYGYRRPNSP